MSKEKIYRVYMHRHPGWKRRYIGCTTQPLKKRWGRGYYSLDFQLTIERYGWDGFEHKILFETTDKKKAMEMEEFYIKKYKTTNPRYGYNLSPKSIGLH